MISMLVYSSKQEEMEVLQNIAREIVAFQSDERLEIIQAADLKACKKTDVMDLAIVDITVSDGLAAAKYLRSQFPTVEIMLVSDSSISPMSYLTPAIRAASLLLKPFVHSEIRKTMEEFFKLVIKVNELDSGEEFFVFEHKGDSTRIPYNKIYYFEARSKKIFLRLESREYGLYGIMDNIAESSPKEFMRCHRSYIVNARYICKIRYSENIIILEQDMMIPLSRSYKGEIKEALKNERND